MEMIGKESIVRDRPIYLQFMDRDDVYNSFWYVIEEKEDDGIEEEIHDKTDDQKNKSNNTPTETDKIRKLRVPHIIYPHDSLIVLNSRLYAIGGDGYPDKCPYYDSLEYWESGKYREGVSRNVFYFDTKNPGEGWLEGPTLCCDRYDQVVAALENSGVFVVFGFGRDDITEPFAEFLDDLNGEWWNSPPIPTPECLEFENIRLLAVTDTKVYIHCLGYDRDHVGMGLSYDFQNAEWKMFDKNFDGWWYPGVVLHFNSNSYLFIFGEKLKWATKEECAENEFYVYDLDNCTWLPSVEGLPKDGKVLPVEGYDIRSDEFCNELISRKYLLRMNQKNKLALLWSKKYTLCGSDEIQTTIHCSKFNILCDFDSDSQLPIFRAGRVSFGSFDVDGDLYNCAASLIGEDNKKFGLSKEWMEI